MRRMRGVRGSPPSAIDHPATSLGPRCAIAARSFAIFSKEPKAIRHGTFPVATTPPSHRTDRTGARDSALRFLHHQPLIQSDHMKYGELDQPRAMQ
jgi:hypothetical protein